MIIKYKTALLFMLVLALTACQHQDPVDAAASNQPEMPDQEIWNSMVKMTNKGQLSAIIHFGHMSRYMKKSMMLFDQKIDIDFYNDNGEIGSKLKSDAGEYYQDTKNVKAVGNVAVESDSGVTLYTQELYYYQDSDRILSKVNVKVTTAGGDTLYGKGFESDAQMSHWEIKEPYDGVAHKNVDLSLQQFKKADKADSSVADSIAVPDSLSMPDTTGAATP